MFNPVKFEESLREAVTALDCAATNLEGADPEQIDAPGRDYLLARLHLALEIVELELPELKRAAMSIVACEIAK